MIGKQWRWGVYASECAQFTYVRSGATMVWWDELWLIEMGKLEWERSIEEKKRV